MECGVADPWFQHIASGAKTVEGRLNKGKFAGLSVGSVLTVRGRDGSGLKCHVTRIATYKSFKEMLEQEGLRHVLPGVIGIANGVSVYRKFYSAKDEAVNGVVRSDAIAMVAKGSGSLSPTDIKIFKKLDKLGRDTTLKRWFA